MRKLLCYTENFGGVVMLDKVVKLQNNAVNSLLGAYNLNKKEITFKAPTGAGKTFIMAKFMDMVLLHEPKTVFIVSSLSKAKLAEQNHSKFRSYQEHGYVKLLKPYLISSESSGENSLYISPNDNVYSLPRDLYKDKSKLKSQNALIRFIQTVKKDRRIILIKDECHIATKNLDEIGKYFDKIINISATPKTMPDAEITEFQAIEAKLIKSVIFNSTSSYSDFDLSQLNDLREALKKFKKLKEQYHRFNINPCFIIQISNKELGQKQFQQIVQIFNEPEFKDLKFVSVAQDPKLCSTNDQLIKSNPSKWEKYAIPNDSLIDIIIFKMVITEGWDIPRACMLFQVRDSKSKQLDEQVLGRVRRNPLLLDFENIPDNDKQILTTAYVWGIREDSKKKDAHPVQVKLKGETPFEIAQVKNQIQDEIKVLTTRIKDLTSIQTDFDINEYLEKVEDTTTGINIFALYEELRKSTNDIQKSCDRYCSSHDNYYQSWFKFNHNINSIRIKSKKVLSDYNNSMEIVKDYNGKYIQYTLPFDSLYFTNKDCILAINDWIWENDDEYKQFTFDSEAERNWINKMVQFFNVKKVNIAGKEIKLLGKNFLVNSNIKYQYYSNGVHDSYPDFIMKDHNNRYFLFEVKSLNQSSNLAVNGEKYKEKISDLQNLYKGVSSLLDYYFCLPILKGSDWNVWLYHNGEEQLISFDELVKLINDDNYDME